MTWDQLGSHSLTFLLGVSVGAAGQYMADKFTDQRRKQEARSTAESAWRQLEAKHTAIFEEIRNDLAESPLVRYLFVLPHARVSLNSSTPHFRYFEEVHPDIHAQMGILEDAGLIVNETISNVPRYRMLETFVDQLTEGASLPDASHPT